MLVACFKLLNPTISRQGVTVYMPFNSNNPLEYNPNGCVTENNHTIIDTTGALITRTQFEDDYPFLNIACINPDYITGKLLMPRAEALAYEKAVGNYDAILQYCKAHGFNKVINYYNQKDTCQDIESVYLFD